MEDLLTALAIDSSLALPCFALLWLEWLLAAARRSPRCGWA